MTAAPAFKTRADAEADADATLQWLWTVRVDGLATIPVDPAFIARAMGIEVYISDLPEDVSGLLVKEPDNAPEIYVSRATGRNRQRYSVAHELGHYRERITEDDQPYRWVDYRGPSAKNGDQPREVYANQFAAALLMPAPLVKQLFQKGLDDVLLATTFGVSAEAMFLRRKNLRLSRPGE